MYKQQAQFKPFRTPSQIRAPVHPALASSPSPVSNTTTSPAQRVDPTGSGAVRSPYGSPQNGRAPGAFGGPALGQEVGRPANGREEGVRKARLNGEEVRAPPQLQPINPAPRSSSRTYPDMRSPPPPQPLASPPPPVPNPPTGEPNMANLANVASHNPNASSNGDGSWKTMIPNAGARAGAGAGVNGIAGVTHTRERSGSLRPQPPPLIIPSDPRQPQAQAQSYPAVQPPSRVESHSRPQSQNQPLPEARNVQSSQSQSLSQPHAQIQGQMERSHRAEQKLQEVQRSRNQNRDSRFEDADHFEIPREAPPAYTPSPARERVVSPVVSLSLPPGAAPAQLSGQSSHVQQPQPQQRHQQQQDLATAAARPQEPQSQPQPQPLVQSGPSTQSQISSQTPPRPAPRKASSSSPTVPTRATQPQSHPQNHTQPPTTPTRPRSETPRRRDGDGREPMSEASKYARAVAVAMRSDSMSSSETGARHATVTNRGVGAGAGVWDFAAEKPSTPSKMERLQTPRASLNSLVGSEQGDGSPRKRPLPHVPGGGTSIGPGVGMGQRGSMIVPVSNKALPQVENQVEKQGTPERKLGKEIRKEEPPMIREEKPLPVEKIDKEAPLPVEKDSLRPPEPIVKSPKVGRPVSQTLAFEFPRSPTLPPLVDPRNAPPSSTTSPLATPAHQGSEQEHDPISKWTAGTQKSDETTKTNGTPLPPLWGGDAALPPRKSSIQGLGVQSGLSQPPPGKRTVSSPLSGRSSPMFMSPLGGMSSPLAPSQNSSHYSRQGARSVSQPLPTLPNSSSIPTLPPLLPSEPIPELAPRGPRPKATITFILAYSSIQAVLLPYLSINSFLSLTGSSEQVRRRFTGEMVGRWVMREWGMGVSKTKGGAGGKGGWPNLTVWEGFLESLLHDPASFSTYPAQWYSLLQHLCLSHTLVTLHLRSLPNNLFPNPPPMAFEDDFALAAPHLPFSSSHNSLSSHGRPRSRVSSFAGSDAGSVSGPMTPGGALKMPKAERLVEIVMPEPLAARSADEADSQSSRRFPPSAASNRRRRGSNGSLTSTVSMPFMRKRPSNSAMSISEMPLHLSAAPMPASGKANLPPVSYPSAKRYGFRRHGEPSRSRASLNDGASGRAGSIFSVASSPSIQNARMWSAASSRASFALNRNAPPASGFSGAAGLPMPPPIGGSKRGSFSSLSEHGRSSQSGNNSPIDTMSKQEFYTPSPPATKRVEPAFDKPMPYSLEKAPLLRVFVPLTEIVQKWPSVEGAAAAVRELEKCGAMRKLKLGDLVINTAIRAPKTTEHVLIYVPFTQHLLLPLSYTFSPTGHLPPLVNAFQLPPSYYHPFLPTPQIVYLDLAPFGEEALSSLRLAYDRRDMIVASGARVSAKRYLHVAGFQVRSGDGAEPGWEGFVSLESEGTAEGKNDIEKRLVGARGGRPIVGPWEVVRDKCMVGNIWLKLVKEE
ncbi:hypothetical protein I309_03263 [Cryptococcus deuterogattii LA55]|nr:hypothetical protein I309_03263 [Cryptococcus deuterogattii LA55]KIR90574.1 hypothetical protein I304_05716 [Cryptococcus deuterogattii CBS 10090]